MFLLNKKSSFDKNILGISPKSSIWEYWSKIYKLNNKFFFLEFSTNQKINKLIFLNLNIKIEDFYFKVDRSNI